MQPKTWSPKINEKYKKQNRHQTCNLEHKKRRNRNKLMFTSRDETLLDLEPLKKTNTIKEKQVKMRRGALRAQEAKKKT